MSEHENNSLWQPRGGAGDETVEQPKLIDQDLTNPYGVAPVANTEVLPASGFETDVLPNPTEQIFMGERPTTPLPVNPADTSWLGEHPTHVMPQVPETFAAGVPSAEPTQQYPTQQYPTQQYPTQQYPTQQGFSALRQQQGTDAETEHARLEYGTELTDADKRFLYVNGEPTQGYRRHRFYEFMGMRPEFLARYPQERAAVVGRFSLVFVTVLCSFFGMYYTMFLAFNNSNTPNAGAIGFAIAFVFAAIIFVIDLSIIRDFSVPKGMRSDFAISDFKTRGFGRNLFRVIISICIAIIVSHSLVIFFFRSDIQADLAEYNQGYQEKYVAQLVQNDKQLAQEIQKLGDTVTLAQGQYDAALATRDAQQICLTNERAGLSNSDVPPEQRCTIGTTSGVAGRSGNAVARESALAEANTALATAGTTLTQAKAAQATGTTAAREAALKRAETTYADGGKRASLIDQSKSFMRVANANKAEVYPIAIAIALALMAIDLLPLVAKYTLKTPMHNTHLANLMLRTVSGSQALRRARQHRNLEDTEYDNTVYTNLAREEARRMAEMERIKNREMVTRFAHASKDLTSEQLLQADPRNLEAVARGTGGFTPLPAELRAPAPELSQQYVQQYGASTSDGGYQPRSPRQKVDREIVWPTHDGQVQQVGETRDSTSDAFVSQLDVGRPGVGSGRDSLKGSDAPQF